MNNQTLDILLKAADEGDRHAQASVGEALLGLPGNEDLARYYFLKSAEAKSPNGMFGAGRCLLMGIGGPASQEMGEELLGAAASYGQPSAVRTLIEGYGEGMYGIKPDPTMLAVLLGNAALNSMRDIPALPTSQDFWIGVNARAMAEASVSAGIGAFWSGPVYTYMAAISWGMDVSSPNFDYMALHAAERGCSEAAKVMAKKSKGATREFWILKAASPDTISAAENTSHE